MSSLIRKPVRRTCSFPDLVWIHFDELSKDDSVGLDPARRPKEADESTCKKRVKNKTVKSIDKINSQYNEVR
jgi:hypothetical protein